MAERDIEFELPFDPGEEPAALDLNTATAEERAINAAHAHSYLCRQLLDVMTSSAFTARQETSAR